MRLHRRHPGNFRAGLAAFPGQGARDAPMSVVAEDFKKTSVF